MLINDYSQYESPEALFESFRDKDDRFSAVLNNYTETEEYFNNVEMTDGINYQLYLDKGNDVIAVVEYVYDDSPAQKAGIERGFVIHKINGTQLTTTNYDKLLAQETCTYTYSVIETKTENGEEVISYGNDMKESKAITKQKMDINPILKSTVIVKNGRRIGYFLYDSFTEDTDCIIKTIEKLSANQIDDLILDLRLNGGGYLATLDTLASMLVPEGNEGKLFITENYNNMLGRTFDRGAELSMGQWQRLAIARLLYTDAPILVLDEPMAWMDIPTRQPFIDTIEKLSHNKIIIIITHT
jgi:C-terminal processing protease CtpA/Prc